MKLASILGIGVAGVFVGAAIVEIIHQVRPNLMKKLGAGTRETLRMIGEAFKEGYTGQPATKAKATPSG
jgi:hypothetical protein